VSYFQEDAMETYIILANYTKQGIKNIKDSPGRIEEARKAVEAAGGKWLSWYLTMGRYDLVIIAEAPNAEAVATLMLATGSLGNVTTETLRAFSEDEFKGIVANLP
jgi:uncharacterized protein with GYD domain